MRTVRGPAWDYFARLSLRVSQGCKKGITWSSASWYASKARDSKRVRLLDEELLLSDYLGSGTSTGQVRTTSVQKGHAAAELKVRQRGHARHTEPAAHDGNPVLVRERVAVQAELLPATIVAPPRTRRRDRQPVPSRLARRANESVLEMVNATSAAYALQLQADIPDEQDAGAVASQVPHGTEPESVAELAAHDAGGEPIRLRVQPWHRQELCKMVCRAILFNFQQELRSLQRQPSHGRPMWSFENNQADSFVESARIVGLAVYLSSLHFQVQHGHLRKKYIPGQPLDINLTRLKEITSQERHNMSASFEAQISSRVSEERFVRHFLDGDMSWATVTRLLRRA